MNSQHMDSFEAFPTGSFQQNLDRVTGHERPPYSGKIQTWYGCGRDGATTFAVAAAPEGRTCMVVFDVRISDEADREAIEHLGSNPSKFNSGARLVG